MLIKARTKSCNLIFFSDNTLQIQTTVGYSLQGFARVVAWGKWGRYKVASGLSEVSVEANTDQLLTNNT